MAMQTMFSNESLFLVDPDFHIFPLMNSVYVHHVYNVCDESAFSDERNSLSFYCCEINSFDS